MLDYPGITHNADSSLESALFPVVRQNREAWHAVANWRLPEGETMWCLRESLITWGSDVWGYFRPRTARPQQSCKQVRMSLCAILQLIRRDPQLYTESEIRMRWSSSIRGSRKRLLQELPCGKSWQKLTWHYFWNLEFTNDICSLKFDVCRT